MIYKKKVTYMDDNISKLLANLSQTKNYRNIGVRITEGEYFDLKNYCAQRYLTFSEVIREALKAYLNTSEKK